MSVVIGGASTLGELTAQMSGMTMGQAYDQFMTDEIETDNGPPIGYGNYTSNTPAISGNTGGSISSGASNVDPVDAWHDYVENENPNVSYTTGGIVSGSTVNTVPYSIVGGPGSYDLQAVMPIGVPVEAAVVAMAQAAGVSIDAANLDVQTKQTLVNSYLSVSGAVYDKAKGLVTAWKDEWGRILFPKAAFDAVYDVVKDWENESEEIDIDDVDKSPMANPNATGSFINIPSGFTSTNTVSGEITTYTYTSGRCINISGSVIVYSDTPFTASRDVYPATWQGMPVERNGVIYYMTTINLNQLNPDLPTSTISGASALSWDAAYLVLNGTFGDYPDGASPSDADSYTPTTIPPAGDLATSYDPDTGDLRTEPLVPIHLTDDPYNSTGDTENPTGPTDENNTGVKNPPVPLPIPDTRPSNPDVPLTDSSVVNSTLINELVEELANTVDPQPGQSSGIIPIPMLPAKPNIDPDTGQPDGTYSYPSIIPDSGPGFIHVYNPTPSEFVAFGTWLWVTYADATIEKILNNPFDGVIGAHELYATPNRGGRDNIRSAFLTCPTTADLVTNRYSEIDCGTVIVPEFYGNYLDYSPYSQAYIYLPFIGINEVSIDDIVGHAVNIRYRVDSYSGSCIAMIFVAKDGYQNLCYQFAGSCSVEVPMAGGSQAAIKAAEMQAEAYARASMTSALGNLFGGVGSALMGSLGGALSSIGGIANNYAQAKAGVEAARVANKSSVQHSGQFGASHGAMGQKVPFIIIRNPIQVKVVNYNEDYGFPAHKRVIVGGCQGYLRVREVNVISAHATDEEKMAIEMALKGGVYVS